MDVSSCQSKFCVVNLRYNNFRTLRSSEVPLEKQTTIFVPEILRAGTQFILCKLRKETRREWEEGKFPFPPHKFSLEYSRKCHTSGSTILMSIFSLDELMNSKENDHLQPKRSPFSSQTYNSRMSYDRPSNWDLHKFRFRHFARKLTSLIMRIICAG